MKKLEFIVKMKKNLFKAGLQIKKHSPEILAAVGIAGVVVSTVMACKATTKVDAVLEKSKNDIDKIHNVMNNAALAEEYSQEDGRRDLAIAYAQTGVKLAKIYAPVVSLGVLSLTAILASNNILRKRNVALAAAYATVDKGYKEYRNRVIERFGQDVDHELKYNIKAKKFKETVVDEKTGKENKIKKEVNIASIDEYSDYARFFDSSSPYWDKDPEYNLMFLKAEQNYANDRLKARGYVYLNEVYERLGIPSTKAGQIVGWVYDSENAVGDNFVDFGIYDIYKEKARDFVNGYEPVILLDFNVDGNILDSM